MSKGWGRRELPTPLEKITAQGVMALIAAHDAAPSNVNYSREDAPAWERLVGALARGEFVKAENVCHFKPDGDPEKMYEAITVGGLMLTGPYGDTPASQMFGVAAVSVDASGILTQPEPPKLRLVGYEDAS